MSFRLRAVWSHAAFSAPAASSSFSSKTQYRSSAPSGIESGQQQDASMASMPRLIASETAGGTMPLSRSMTR